jgi:hypothetical protein
MNHDVLVVGAGPTAMAAATGQMVSWYGTCPLTGTCQAHGHKFGYDSETLRAALRRERGRPGARQLQRLVRPQRAH